MVSFKDESDNSVSLLLPQDINIKKATKERIVFIKL
jgi:hypothetical protein